MRDDENVILIGMPGVGKSTIGVLLAKAMSRDFIDSDVYIQAVADCRLQDIIDRDGMEEFRRVEELYVMSLDIRGYVVATGGSVVYSEKLMRHLAETGRFVHLALSFEQLKERLTNLDSRGVVMAPGQTLRDLYQERMPLYRRWADVTVDCSGKDHQQVLDAVLSALGAG